MKRQALIPPRPQNLSTGRKKPASANKSLKNSNQDSQKKKAVGENEAAVRMNLFGQRSYSIGNSNENSYRTQYSQKKQDNFSNSSRNPIINFTPRTDF